MKVKEGNHACVSSGPVAWAGICRAHRRAESFRHQCRPVPAAGGGLPDGAHRHFF